eukprot:2608816-Rhodomonas_salina.1
MAHGIQYAVSGTESETVVSGGSRALPHFLQGGQSLPIAPGTRLVPTCGYLRREIKHGNPRRLTCAQTACRRKEVLHYPPASLLPTSYGVGASRTYARPTASPVLTSGGVYQESGRSAQPLPYLPSQPYALAAHNTHSHAPVCGCVCLLAIASSAPVCGCVCLLAIVCLGVCLFVFASLPAYSISLRQSYAIPGTGVAYQVLMQRSACLVPRARYCRSRPARYSSAGTGVAFDTALCHGMSGAGTVESAEGLRSALSAAGAIVNAEVPSYAPPMPQVRYHWVPCYACPTPCPVLRSRARRYQDASGLYRHAAWAGGGPPGVGEVGYPEVCACKESGTDMVRVPPGLTEVSSPMKDSASGMALRACYAMPGTDMAYGTIALLLCYEMPGTDLAYADPFMCFGSRRKTPVATPLPSTRSLCNLRYLPTRPLCNLRYLPTRSLRSLRYLPTRSLRHARY